MDSTQELGEHIVTLAGHINAATQVLLTMIADFDVQEGWKAEGRTSCAHWLSSNTKMTMTTAYEHIRVAHCLRQLPAIDEAFSQGRVSYTQVRAMTRVADEDCEETLLADAETMSGQELELKCRGMRARDTSEGAKPPERYVRQRTMGDGTVELRVRLTADEAEMVQKAMREVMERNSSAGEPSEEEQEGEELQDEASSSSRFSSRSYNVYTVHGSTTFASF